MALFFNSLVLYHMLLIIRDGKVSLSQVLTFIPEKNFGLPATPHSLNRLLQKFTKNVCGCKVFCEKVNFFTTNNTQYIVTVLNNIFD